MSSKINQIISDWFVINTENDYYANAEMLAWALDNCQSKFYHRGNKFWFHNEKDATMFALKYATYNKREKVTFSY